MLLLDWRLALVAFSVIPLIASSRNGSASTSVRRIDEVRLLDRANQRVAAGEHHWHVDGSAVPARVAELRQFDGSIATT